MAWRWRSLLGLLLFRLLNSVVVGTYSNPDEYWQSLEVAHRLVFGYGHLTWEWKEGIRGYTHILLFACLYKVIQLLGIDWPVVVEFAPRFLQATFAFINDVFLYKLAERWFGHQVAKWSLICQLFSWFTFYCGVRPFSNSLETTLTTIALYYWPWEHLTSPSQITRNTRFALTFAAAACVIRPTSAVLWLFLGVRQLFSSTKPLSFLFGSVLPIGTLAILISIIVDRFCYGYWTLVIWNFIKFNIFQGVGSFYGTHRFHWYFLEGFPVMLFTEIPLFIGGFILSPRNKRILGHIIGWVLLVYSFQAHKEFRFVFPVLPLSMIYCGYCIEQVLQYDTRSSRKKKSKSSPNPKTIASLGKWLVSILLLAHIPMSVYFSIIHQRAPVTVIKSLQQIETFNDLCQMNPSQEPTIHFLMPCHSTPYYASLHRNFSLWFPDCSPTSLNEKRTKVESQELMDDPKEFVQRFYSSQTLPDFIVMFEPMKNQLATFLHEARFIECKRYFHSYTPLESYEGHYVLLFCRSLWQPSADSH